MRIHFRNLGHAEHCLKECRKALLKEAQLPQKAKVPSQMIRNAFCKAFGYSSYAEFKKLCVLPTGDAWEELNTTELDASLVRGWGQACEILRDSQHLDASLPNKVPDPLASTIQGSFIDRNSPELRNLVEGLELVGVIHDDDIYGDFFASSARRIFGSMLRQNPESVDALTGFMELAWRRKEYSEVKRLSSLAIEKSRQILGDVSPNAHEWWSVVKTRPYMKALYFLARALWCLGEFLEAIKTFEEIAALKPGKPGMEKDAWLAIGNIRLESGDVAGALESYGKCDLSKDAENSYNRAYALIQDDRIGEAVQQLRMAFKLDENIACVLLELKRVFDPNKGIRVLTFGKCGDDEQDIYAKSSVGKLWKENVRAYALLKAIYANHGALNALSLLVGLKEAVAASLEKCDGDKVREFLSKEILSLDSSDRVPVELNHRMVIF